jgi:hypothetical protein
VYSRSAGDISSDPQKGQFIFFNIPHFIPKKEKRGHLKGVPEFAEIEISLERMSKKIINALWEERRD